MAKQPRGYQLEALELFERLNAVLCVLDCGLGKTLVATLAAKQKDLPAIIVAPKHLTRQWQASLIEEGISADDIFVYDRPTHTKKKQDYEGEFAEWLTNENTR